MKLSLLHLFFMLFISGCNYQKQEDKRILKLDAVSSSISQNDDKIVYSAWDTSVNIYSLATNKKVFQKKLDEICYAKPVLKGNLLYFPFSTEKFICTQFSDRKKLWEAKLQGRCSNFDFLDDSTILASVNNYGLIALKAKTGEKLYELRYNYAESLLPDLSPWPVSLDSANFYVSNWQGNTVSSFKKKDGSLNWHFKSKTFGYAGTSILFEDKIFVGEHNFYKSGTVFILETQSGMVIHEQSSKFESHFIPVVHDKFIYFYTYDDAFNRFDLSDFSITRIRQFDDKTSMGGNQIFLINDNFYYSGVTFNINRYSIKDSKFFKMGEFQKSLIGAFEYNGEVFFI